MSFLRTLAVASTVGLMAMSTASAATWAMPTPYPEAEFHTKNNRLFAEEVEKATGGSLKINVHSGQSLFKHPEIKRAVQTGQVPIAEMLMANLLNEDPMYGVEAVPFLATTYEESANLWAAQNAFAQARIAKHGLRLLSTVPLPGPRFPPKKPHQTHP